MAEALRIGVPSIEVQLRRNLRARRMVLRVARNGCGPTLTLPPGVTLARAKAFLVDQEAWLRHQVGRVPPRVPVRAGSVLPFGDGVLEIRPTTGRLHHDGSVLLVPGCKLEVPVRVSAYLRECARQACVVGVDRHAAALGHSPGRITLRDPRSRWGSCTATGDLMFSWRLVMAPAAVLDYVIAHEVAHLQELNHSARFWTLVRRMCPGCDGPREWLRRHGATLHAHDFSGAA